MRFAPAVLVLLLVLPAAAFAQDDDAFEKECRKWVNVPIPQQDIGTAPKDCSSGALYYGDEETKPDYAAARQCAYQERKDQKQDAPYSDYDSILMMLYANSEGVERNIPLAKRFACENDVSNGWDGGLLQLQILDDIASGKEKQIGLCDATVGSRMEGLCSGEIDAYKADSRKKH